MDEKVKFCLLPSLEQSAMRSFFPVKYMFAMASTNKEVHTIIKILKKTNTFSY